MPLHFEEREEKKKKGRKRERRETARRGEEGDIDWIGGKNAFYLSPSRGGEKGGGEEVWKRDVCNIERGTPTS